MGDELVTVPDFPAWVCDLCRYREYDLAALKRLHGLLLPPIQQAKTGYTGAEQRKNTDHLPPPV